MIILDMSMVESKSPTERGQMIGVGSKSKFDSYHVHYNL